jgi:hypothetical protein
MMEGLDHLPIVMGGALGKLPQNTGRVAMTTHVYPRGAASRARHVHDDGVCTRDDLG